MASPSGRAKAFRQHEPPTTAASEGRGQTVASSDIESVASRLSYLFRNGIPEALTNRDAAIGIPR